MFFQKDKRKLEEKLWAKWQRESSHRWMFEEVRIRRVFRSFVHMLSARDIRYLIYKRKILFVRGNNQLGLTFHPKRKTSCIVVFPELYNMLLAADPTYAMAVLAHELGHIILGHDRRPIDPMQAQYEADAFACHMGLSDALKNLLMNYSERKECRLRLERIQSQL